MLKFCKRPDYYPPMPPQLDLHYRIDFRKAKNMRVLNVGAGSGLSSLAMQLPFIPFKELTFVDCHAPYLDSAKARVYQAGRVNFVCMDVRNFQTVGYDLVLMFDVLEHLPKQDSLQLMKDIKCSQLIFIPLETKPRPNTFGATSQDHLSFWTEDNFKTNGYFTEVLPLFHEEAGEKFDALWALKN